ncbi:unnamed protein product [Mycena citricolor]|uniref:Uncharacterized protein n=1 Tax=Mycena citricolor TaxID=2018698 RepID=A0AAD2HIB4_9AGAR|nr:unnamed protein product [Mycena citricolor]
MIISLSHIQKLVAPAAPAATKTPRSGLGRVAATLGREWSVAAAKAKIKANKADKSAAAVKKKSDSTPVKATTTTPRAPFTPTAYNTEALLLVARQGLAGKLERAVIEVPTDFEVAPRPCTMCAPCVLYKQTCTNGYKLAEQLYMGQHFGYIAQMSAAELNKSANRLVNTLDAYGGLLYSAHKIRILDISQFRDFVAELKEHFDDGSDGRIEAMFAHTATEITAAKLIEIRKGIRQILAHAASLDGEAKERFAAPPAFFDPFFYRKMERIEEDFREEVEKAKGLDKQDPATVGDQDFQPGERRKATLVTPQILPVR